MSLPHMQYYSPLLVRVFSLAPWSLSSRFPHFGMFLSSWFASLTGAVLFPEVPLQLTCRMVTEQDRTGGSFSSPYLLS